MTVFSNDASATRLQLCPSSVLIDDGVVVADGPTRELLAAHRLGLPFGFVSTGGNLAAPGARC